MAEKIFKLHCRKGAESILFDEEKNALERIIHKKAHDRLPRHFKGGTFVLKGQKYDEETQFIMQFNLSGSKRHYDFFRTYERRVKKAIDNVLSGPVRKSRFINSSEITKLPQKIESGIYFFGKLRTLVLNAKFGCFIASCYLDLNKGGGHESKMMLVAVSGVIAHMCKEDEVLQESLKTISLKDPDFGNIISREIAELFDESEILALETWREWRKTPNGRSKLFFE